VKKGGRRNEIGRPFLKKGTLVKWIRGHKVKNLSRGLPGIRSLVLGSEKKGEKLRPRRSLKWRNWGGVLVSYWLVGGGTGTTRKGGWLIEEQQDRVF